MVPNVVKSQNVDGICRTMNFKHSAINLAPVYHTAADARPVIGSWLSCNVQPLPVATATARYFWQSLQRSLEPICLHVSVA